MVARAGVSFSLTSGRPHWLRFFWSFLTLYPSESRGYRALGLLCVLGISFDGNCSFFSLRWKSVASGSHKVKCNRFGYTWRPRHSLGIWSKTLINSSTWKFWVQSALLLLTSVRHSGIKLQKNKPKQQQKHLKKEGQRVQQRQKVRAKEVFWNIPLVPRNEGGNKIVQDLEGSLLAGWSHFWREIQTEVKLLSLWFSA